jgi:hypothetical protein
MPCQAPTPTSRTRPLMAPDRILPFSTPPSHSLAALQSLQKSIASFAAASYPSLITSVGSEVRENRVRVGASDVQQATEILHNQFGSGAPITVQYQPVSRPRRSGRERVTGPIRAGDVVRLLDGPNSPAKEKLVGSLCTNAFGAFDKVNNKQTGQVKTRMFVLTASHCIENGP